MKKVVSPEEMAMMDRYTIQSGISGKSLMGKAGEACSEIIGAGLSLLDKVIVICGGGNNGGDGFVIAKCLADQGHPVRVLFTGKANRLTEESRYYFDQLSEGEMPVEITMMENSDPKEVKDLLAWSGFVVDCLFGNGLTDKPLSETYRLLIKMINDSGKFITSIDIPSGLRGDIGFHVGAAVKADRTIAIQCVKTGCLINDGPDYCGEIQVVDIGIVGDSDMRIFEFDDLSWPSSRKKNSHKYDYGSVSAIVSSPGMYGAGQMACEAALTMGCGLVTAYVPEQCYETMTARIAPEIMVQYYHQNLFNSDFEYRKNSVTLFGCGVGRQRDFSKMLRYLLDGRKPVVIDADGLWHLSQDMGALNHHEAPLVLTPHLGEFSMLTGLSVEDIASDPVAIGRSFAEKYNTVLVLKGYHTMVISPEGKVFFNSSGNPGMATAGSGDVLAGMIAGIIAQKVDPLKAAVHAVYYHGAAGDVYAGRFNEITLRATDILSFLKIVININDKR